MPVVPPFANLNLQEDLDHSFQAGAAILQYQRVKLTAAGTVIPAVAADDLSFGVARANMAIGELKAIRLDMHENFGRSNTLINVGDTVYTAAGGLVTAAAGGIRLGVARIGAPVPSASTDNKQAAVVILQVRAETA